jgi:hypothetical protein
MNWPDFQTLSWRGQNEFLVPVIRSVLAGRAKPLETRELAMDLAHHLKWPQDDRTLGKLLGILLRRFATRYDFATHDGVRFHAMGREMRRWRWHLPKAAPAHIDTEVDLFS